MKGLRAPLKIRRRFIHLDMHYVHCVHLLGVRLDTFERTIGWKARGIYI